MFFAFDNDQKLNDKRIIMPAAIACHAGRFGFDGRRNEKQGLRSQRCLAKPKQQ
jgi:hypothetical protein